MTASAAPALFIDPQAAARFLGISITTLRRWRHQGQLVKGVHYIQYGPNTIRYDRQWLEKFRATGGKGSHKLEVRDALRARR